MLRKWNEAASASAGLLSASALQKKFDDVRGMAAMFKALADETRLKIVYGLHCTELCGHELAALLDITPAAVSHHLRILRGLRIVAGRREGKEVYYTLADEHIRSIITASVDHWKEDAPW